MRAEKRFKALCKRLGFVIRKVPYRNDIRGVYFGKHKLFIIPKVIYDRPNPNYRALYLKIQNPDYFQLEMNCYHFHSLIKTSNWLNEKKQLENEQA